MKLYRFPLALIVREVAPLAGARIETSQRKCYFALTHVAPLAGARIETMNVIRKKARFGVAPLAGARIETRVVIVRGRESMVAPLAGARIETHAHNRTRPAKKSLPSRERELKHQSYRWEVNV